VIVMVERMSYTPTAVATTGFAEARQELATTPTDFFEHLTRRAILTDDYNREKGPQRRFTALELAEADAQARRAFPGVDPQFRAAFVRRSGGDERTRSFEQLPEVRALGSTARTETTDRTFSDTLFAALVAQSPILGLATLVRTSTGSPHGLSYVATDSAANGIVTDGSSITVADPVFGRAQFNAYSYKDRLVLSEELFYDGAFDAEDYAARMFAAGPSLRAFGVHTISGDGSSKPLGLANSGTLTTVTAAGASAIVLDDVAKALEDLPTSALPNASIVLSHGAWFDIIRATEGTSGAGGRSINPTGYVGKLWNFPTYVDPALTNPATGVITGLVGDFKSAYAVRLAPIRVDVDHHATLATDQVGVRAVIRGDATTMVAGSARALICA
jgi:HK97 family phage major capsid protein